TSEDEFNHSQTTSSDPHHRNDSSIPKREPGPIFYLINGFFLILVSLIIIASLLEFLTAGSELERRGGHVWKALMSFSLPRNSHSIFSLHQTPDAIHSLDAIRVVSFAWVATVHTFKLYIDKG
ncbi:hypothetical protein PMAYCL1PPCAC_16321, partial [Pristionchus mayeri]